MRILFTVQPATGHLNPLVPVAHAANAAGHDVAVCSSPSFASAVELFGFEYFGVGLDWVASDRNTWAAFPPMPPPPDPAFPDFVVTVFADITTRAMAPDVLALAEDWKPDLIVRELMEWSGYLAAERLGIPHASVGGNAYSGIDSPEVNYFPGNRRKVAEPLARHLAELDLPPDPDVETPFRYLHMCFMPPRWDRPEASALPNTRYFRHSSAASPLGETLSWLDDLADQPTILATLGTIATPATPAILDAIVGALRDEPVNLILAAGRGQDLARFGRLSANIHVESYVPQAELLTRCDLFLTHGGFNSVKEALSLGVPVVVVPIMSDQPYSAERCAALELGQVIDREHRTPADIRDAVRAVLADPSYRANTEAFQQEMLALPGPDQIPGALEELVAVAHT